MTTCVGIAVHLAVAGGVYDCVIRGSTGGFLLLRYFSGIVSHHGVFRVSQYSSVSPHL